MNNTEWMRTRLLQRAGLWEPPKPKHRLEDLAKSEWSSEFEQYMRNRLIMGALRYGVIGAPGKPQYNRVDSMKRRLDAYVTTGNLERLVDVANICMLEYLEGTHPLRHFSAIDDVDGTAEHAQVVKKQSYHK